MKRLIQSTFILSLFTKISFGDIEGAVRLKSDCINNYEGIVEIYHNGMWGSIDQRDITDKTASVICRLLGFGDVGFEIDYYYTLKRTQRIFSYVYCDGYETSVLDCSFSLRTVYNTTYGAGVICKEFDSTKLRLQGGSSTSEGKLQFLYDGEWNEVCEDTVDYDNYHLACKQMGYGIVESYRQDLTINSGYDVLPFKYYCNSNDINLDACQTRVYSYTNCSKSGRIIIKCKNFQLTNSRINGGIDNSNGRVELFDGSWKTVCSAGFTSTVADVVCRNSGRKTALSYGEYGANGNVEIIPYYMYCDAYETDIKECTVINNNYSCSHNNDVSIICSNFQINQVRLVDGQDNSQGRIEFFIDNAWMTFCDRTYRNDNLDVICKMKGYRTAKKAYRDAYFGEGSGGIITNWIYCGSNDAHINDCEVRSNSYTCTHSDDLSVDCSNFAIIDSRLVNGNGSHEGRLEVRVDGDWMTVCDATFLSGYGLDTMCKSLGYRGVVEILPNAYFGQGTGDIVTHYFSCPTDAESLSDCNVRYSGYGGCTTHSDDLSVVCSDLEIQDIRLVNGPFANEGRVEILIDDEWRTVCGSYWYTNDMDVLCRTLGFSEADEYYYNAYYGEGIGKILTTDFYCNGRESTLKNCTIRNYGNTCTHSADFSIKCIACVSLDIPTNGLITISGTSHGDIARFDCKPGFGLIGSELRVCQSNNTWNGTDAECIIDCGSLPSPLNGSSIITSTLHQETVLFECDPGFDLVGITERTCLENGTWNGSSPTCKIKDCGPVEAPHNGSVDTSSGTLFTAEATFRCNTGFTLYGDTFIRCLADGTWSRINTLCLESDSITDNSSQKGDKLKEGLLYGGIAVAIVIGVLIGVIVTMFVIRKRRSQENTSNTHTNSAYDNQDCAEYVYSSDHYDSMNDNPNIYQNIRPPPRRPILPIPRQ